MPPPEPMQCCPADTYSGRTDVDGNEVADCSCGDGCACLCRECRCPSGGWDDDWLNKPTRAVNLPAWLTAHDVSH